MKKLLSTILIVTLIISQLFLFVGCGDKAKSDTSFGEDWLLNTYCYIKTFNPGEENVIKDAFKLAREYENKLSKTVKGSLVDQLNSAGEETGLNVYDENIKDLSALLIMSSIFTQITEGSFDVSVGNLTDIWDFTSGNGKVPSEEAITKALELTGFDKVYATSDGEIHKQSKDVKIDFGAIAKGYIADRITEYLRANGVSSAIISLGGNIVCLGQKPDSSAWQIGIEKPNLVTSESAPLEQRETIGSITCPNDYSVVTSGTYERYIKDGDKIYHHILNPKTGYSVETDLTSATIIGPASVICDALSTTAILLGSDQGAKVLDMYNELYSSNGTYEYVLIKDDGTIIRSTNANLE